MRQSAKGILIVVAAFVILVAINLFLYVDNNSARENESNGNRSSYASTPYGTLAYYTLLNEDGVPVTRLTRPFTTLERSPEIGTLVVIAPPPEDNPSADELKSLNSWIESGGLLIVIDREIELTFPGDVKVTTGGYYKYQVQALQPTVLTRGVEKVEPPTMFVSRVKVESKSAVLHIGGTEGAILADTKIGRGRAVFLSEPFIVANNGIQQGDNSRLAVNLVRDRPAGRVAFDEYHHGYGTTGRWVGGGGILGYFKGTPVPWMLGQTILIGVLVIFTQGRRFGRPLPLRRERRTTNLEFVTSMATITRLARATGLAMQNIYSEFRRTLCRYCNMPPRVETAGLARAAAQKLRIDERELHRLLFRCEQIIKGSVVSDSEMLALVSRIREIEEMLKVLGSGRPI